MASGLRGLGLRPRPDPYHELRPLPLGAHALVVVEDPVAPQALNPADVIEPEAPRPEDPELGLIAAVRALDHAVPLPLPMSLDIKSFRPGLKSTEVIALLGRITTALTGLHRHPHCEIQCRREETGVALAGTRGLKSFRGLSRAVH